MAKYTLHDIGGNYLQVSSRSLNIVKRYCNEHNRFAVVCETKCDNSVWDNTPVDIGVPVYHNDKPREAGYKYSTLKI